MVLALIGGIAGIGLAYVGIRLFAAFSPPNVPRLQDAGLHVDVMIFAVGISWVPASFCEVHGVFSRYRLVSTRRPFIAAEAL